MARPMSRPRSSGGVAGVTPHFARQEPQLGTGHAVQQAAPLLPDDGTVVVLSGDVPLIGDATPARADRRRARAAGWRC